MARRHWLLVFLLVVGLQLAWTTVGVAQDQAALQPIDWKQLLATFINGTLVLVLVSLINAARPMLRERYPWAIPLAATALGPVIGALQAWAAAKLGYQVDFSPILSALAGAAATTTHQVWKNLPERR